MHCVAFYQQATKHLYPSLLLVMKCVPAPDTGRVTWDVRITCKDKHTKLTVYGGLKYQAGLWYADKAIVNFALMTERMFTTRKKVWDGEWVWNEDFKQGEWVGSITARVTDEPTDASMDIVLVVTTEKALTNPTQLWERKLNTPAATTLGSWRSMPASRTCASSHYSPFVASAGVTRTMRTIPRHSQTRTLSAPL